MKDWIFPSMAFLVFLYGIFFAGLYIYNYKNSSVSIFAGSKDTPVNQSIGIDDFLQEISKSFK
ncbi:hypothetical protein CCY99_03170 [Helicobacter sp. 16-1353]|uniref:hypothetical protein n=1 Tax=Helicobacter sp. 16-1353 TaxID=2004996 RepID=UPI000DCC3C5A|nr:hypothetical protein [Helicobacter sp. 16-1353]RAX54371.1 hypothetical protein CCY99_03170 [Helicobacter sp. 16-1353]